MSTDETASATVTIRRANGTDLEAIREIAEAAWRDAYDDVEVDAADVLEEWYDPARLERRFTAEDVEFLVAETAGTVTGFCHGVIEDEEGHILRLYVDPDAQGEGIGRALHDEFADRCHDHGVARLYAYVFADNDVGCGFYEALDFRRADSDTTAVGGETYTEAVYEQSLWPPADT